jgi:uncharacterized protein (AIM24 family)
MANQSSTPFDQGLFLVHLNRGREHFDKRSFADAASELEEARRLRPDDDSVLNLLGLAYFKQEKYKEADSVYRKLIELNPESYTLHFNLGLVCFKTGDLDNAEAIFLRALELKPDNQKTHFYLGNIYEKKKQFYNAIFQYRKAGANIMVKRVQEKIDQERPTEGRSDDGVTKPPETSQAHSSESPEDTSPNVNAASTAQPEVMEAPDTLEKINVDHIDRRRFLTALQTGLFNNDPASATGTTLPPVKVETAVVGGEETSPNIRVSQGPTRTSDTQEEVLSTEQQTLIADTIGERDSRDGDKTVPPPASVTKPTVSRIRLTEPVVPEQSLSDMAKNKVPSDASDELFSERRQQERRDRGSGPTLDIPSAHAWRSGEADSHGQPKVLSWGRRHQRDDDSGVYARMRRRDDIFRYLENNLMEVNFSGKVFIKQGTIYSYSGNLTFWVKPQREESVPPLVIVSGTGKLLLTDRQREISVMRIDDEEIFVEPSHLLACQESLTPRYAIIDKDDGTPGLHVLMIKGSGVIALSVATNPLLMSVQKAYPVNVSSSSLISWAGELNPTIVEDEALAEIMLPGPNKGVNLRLVGEGRVMMEKSSPN